MSKQMQSATGSTTVSDSEATPAGAPSSGTPAPGSPQKGQPAEPMLPPGEGGRMNYGGTDMAYDGMEDWNEGDHGDAAMKDRDDLHMQTGNLEPDEIADLPSDAEEANRDENL